MRRLRDDGGAVAVMMALIICFVLVPLSAMAVDLGMQRTARSDMQSLADVVALDLARHLDGTTDASTLLTEFNGSSGLAAQSAARNMATVGDNATRSVVAQVGTVDPTRYGTSGYFTSVTGSTVPTAVRVIASTKVGFGLARALPGGGVSSGAATRSAVATSGGTACFDIGSFAAAIKSGDSTLLGPLNDLLTLNLDMVSYQGLANATVNLADIAADPAIGSPTALLSAPVSVGALVTASINALQRQGYAPNSVQILALGVILKAVASTPKVMLSNLLNIAPSDSAALHTKMDVLDLVGGAILLASGDHAVNVPSLWAQVAGVGNIVSSNLSVIEGKKRGCGVPNSSYATASTSQVSGTVDLGNLNSPSVNIPGLATLQTSPATGILTVNLANANGAIVSPPPMHCGAGTTADPSSFWVAVNSSLARVDLSSQVTVTGKVSLDLGLGGIVGVLTTLTLNVVVDVDVNNWAPATSKTVQLSIPGNLNQPVSTGSGTALSTANITASIDPSSTINGTLVANLAPAMLTSVTSLVLNPIMNGLIGPTAPLMTKTLVPLIGNINNALTGPLSKLLGLDLAGADLYAVKADCDRPQLVG